MQSASTFLRQHGSVMVTAKSELTPSSQGPDHATVTITAAKTPHTYVFHYFERLGMGIGPWFHKILNPSGTRSSS